MGRALRAATGGMVYHALNRGNARARIFHKEVHYSAFEGVLVEATKRYEMRS